MQQSLAVLGRSHGRILSELMGCPTCFGVGVEKTTTCTEGKNHKNNTFTDLFRGVEHKNSGTYAGGGWVIFLGKNMFFPWLAIFFLAEKISR